MAERIDPFIAAMMKRGADQLLFGTDSPVRVRRDGQEKAVLDQPVQTTQIVKLLEPICGGKIESLHKDGELEFFYDSPHGRMHVLAMRAGDFLSVIVSPELDFEADPLADGLDSDLDAPHDPDIEAVSDDTSAPLEVAETVQIPPRPGSDKVFVEAPVVTDEVLPPPLEESDLPKRADDSEPRRATEGREPVWHRLLRSLVEHDGSDVHLAAGRPPRIRKSGVLQPMKGWSTLQHDQIEGWLRSAASEAVRRRFEDEQDAEFAYEVPGVGRFRVSWLRDVHGTGAVVRAFPSRVPSADKLGLPEAVVRFCHLSQGVVLVTGSMGSGKSTTLAAMLDVINRERTAHVVTLESPVRFIHRPRECVIHQREVPTHCRSFEAGLKAALSEDAEVVLVGSLRTPAAVMGAFELADAGALVLGARLGRSTVGVLRRMLLDMPSSERSALRARMGEDLRGVVHQTLCTRVGGGRVACWEVLTVDGTVADRIAEDKLTEIASHFDTRRDLGNATQTQQLAALVKAGTITAEEAHRVSYDPDGLGATLDRLGA